MTTEPPRPTAERIWLSYLACVAAVAGMTFAVGMPGHDVVRFLWVHAVVLAVVLVSRWCAVHRSHDAARVPRVFLGLIGLPVVFSSLCWLLPHAHPEPYEHTFLAFDRALFGSDAGVAAAHLPAWLIEVLQVCYAGFYCLCIASAVGAGFGGGKPAFDRASLRLVGSFLCSYLGYLLVPTLAPKVVLAFEHEIAGVWATPALRTAIDAGEANLWDCFPSGHTMLTLTSLLSLWRWNRRWFRWLVVPGALLIASTVLLRYHWTLDVVAGALLAWPVARACDWLADRDGWPAVRGELRPD